MRAVFEQSPKKGGIQVARYVAKPSKFASPEGVTTLTRDNSTSRKGSVCSVTIASPAGVTTHMRDNSTSRKRSVSINSDLRMFLGS